MAQAPGKTRGEALMKQVREQVADEAVTGTTYAREQATLSLT
jgi:hypothetical protein